METTASSTAPHRTALLRTSAAVLAGGGLFALLDRVALGDSTGHALGQGLVLAVVMAVAAVVERRTARRRRPAGPRRRRP